MSNLNIIIHEFSQLGTRFFLKSNQSLLTSSETRRVKKVYGFALRFYKISHVQSSVIQIISYMIPCFNRNPKKDCLKNEAKHRLLH